MKPNLNREEVLELWLQTLEQFPERQTNGILGNGQGKFCCLGQLCDLVYDENEKSVEGDADLGSVKKFGAELADTNLPEEVIQFMGFADTIGGIINPDVTDETRLAYMNDNAVPWPEIAKFIRENPDKVFVND
jgi:hypothetical protein